MRGHLPALLAVATLVAPMRAREAIAQPAEPAPAPEGDVPPPADAPAPATDATPPANAPTAEPPPAPVKDPKVARKWLDAANTLVRKGDQLTRQGKADEAKTSYDNAVTAYRKAIESSDDAALQLSLSIALEKAGDLAAAIKACRVLLAAENVKPDVLKKAQARLDDLAMKVGVVSLTITPDGTQLTIGGKSVGEAPLAEPLVLVPGTYTLTLTAVGYQPKDVELKVEAGSESDRKIDLEPIPVVTKPIEVEPTPVAPIETPKPDMVPLFIGGGATIGLLMVATVTGLVALGKSSDFGESNNLAEREDLRSSGKTFALVTDLCLVGAVGAAAFTTYWYLHKVRPEMQAQAERQAAGPKLDVLPWVQSDAGGLAAVGSF